jgi:hypothetical protein
MLGVSLPTDLALDGKDVAAALRNSEASPVESVSWACHGVDALRTQRWKLHRMASRVEIYDIEVDPDMGDRVGDGDRRLQAYCYRMVLTDVPANRVPIAKPAGYDEADYEILFRVVAADANARFFKIDRGFRRRCGSGMRHGDWRKTSFPTTAIGPITPTRCS